MGVKSRIITEKERALIIKLYKGGMAANLVHEEVNISLNLVLGILKENNLMRKRGIQTDAKIALDECRSEYRRLHETANNAFNIGIIR